MPQSFSRVYAHLIFSTKNREPTLDDVVRARVHAYLATLARDMESASVIAGGVADHVHLLMELPKMHSPVRVIEVIKKESSKFVKTLGSRYRDFYWQRGYGLFSVSPIQRGDVETYIRTQEEHHRTISFQDEYRGFLKRYGIEYDERYVWD